MTDPVSLRDVIRKLEESILRHNVRTSCELLDELLSGEFIEFGSSGRTFDKEQTMRALQGDAEERFEIAEFRVRELATGVVLAMYRVTRGKNLPDDPKSSLRSSIWIRERDKWQMLFHQGPRTRSE